MAAWRIGDGGAGGGGRAVGHCAGAPTPAGSIGDGMALVSKIKNGNERV